MSYYCDPPSYDVTPDCALVNSGNGLEINIYKKKGKIPADQEAIAKSILRSKEASKYQNIEKC